MGQAQLVLRVGFAERAARLMQEAERHLRGVRPAELRRNPAQRARAIVKAATHFADPKAVLEASQELGEAMKGLDIRQLDPKDLLQTRGW